MVLLKEYLENGDFVENRLGKLYLFYNSYFIRDCGFSPLRYYDSSLHNSWYPDMDIIAIYKPLAKIDLSSFVDMFNKRLNLSSKKIKQLIATSFYQYTPHFIDLLNAF